MSARGIEAWVRTETVPLECRYRTSIYYSYSRLKTEGTPQLEPGGPAVRVTGRTWFDHEFGSAQLAGNHEGWDRFSTALSDGTDLMVYGIRNQDGSFEPSSSGTLRFADGRGYVELVGYAGPFRAGI